MHLPEQRGFGYCRVRMGAAVMCDPPVKLFILKLHWESSFEGLTGDDEYVITTPGCSEWHVLGRARHGGWRGTERKERVN